MKRALTDGSMDLKGKSQMLGRLDHGTRRKLLKVLGKENFRTDLATRVSYGFDATNKVYLPDGVAFPGSAQEVSSILRLANERSFPVIPRGAGSGFTGGAVPIEGGVVLSTERMNRILSVSREDLVAVVQPGVVTGEFQKEVAKLGLFFPPDPASVEFCTIGGNVAECAGGMRALKYGVTRDYVLGLEVVLPTGEIVRTGGRTVKNVVGYDLTRLMVGSEGTLGVITEITLKLIPLPRARSTVLAFFPSVVSATQAVSQILSSGILPSAMEIVDRASLECVAMSNPVDYPQDTGAMLLVEVDGPEAATKEEARNVAEISREVSALRVVVSQDEKDSESLWKLRRAISPSLARLRPHRLNEDVVVPRSKLAEAMETFRKIGEEYGVPLTTFGHAGDGNIHVNVLYDRNNEDEATRAEKAARRVMEATVALGGSLSGEHGIGITKSQFLPLEVQPEALELMKKVKSLLDPKGILNPGKIFPQDKG